MPLSQTSRLVVSVLVVLFGLLIFYVFLFQSSESLPLRQDSPSIDTLLTPPNPHQGIFVDSNNNTTNISLINASFLHNNSRNYYGSNPPDTLAILWQHDLGIGETRVGKQVFEWAGAGWTGQPLVVEENGELYLIQGAYDHHLKKIRASDGTLVWQYKFDDVIKGTGSLWINHKATSLEDFCLIIQGSRAGKSLYSDAVPSLRAISYFTGNERWRLNSVKTRSYSRDVDASCLLLTDTAYNGLENGIFTIFNPNPADTQWLDGMYQPQIIKNSDTLYLPSDIKKHGGNLVTEASPVLLGNRVYLASGSGHIWGYHLHKKKIDWSYYIGSDIDGTPTVTHDSCLLVAVEKQYINGKGGVLKLNPSRAPQHAAEWYFPVENKLYASWQGGIIGSATNNSRYSDDKHFNLACFTAIDGFLYVIHTDSVSVDSFATFTPEIRLPRPRLLFKYETGPAISTPLFVEDKIIAAGYTGTYLFGMDSSSNYQLIDQQNIRCESTPFVYNNKIYVASRNRYLYCMGQVSQNGQDSVHLVSDTLRLPL